MSLTSIRNNSLCHNDHLYYYVKSTNQMDSQISTEYSNPEIQTYDLLMVMKFNYIILIFLIRHKLDILYAVAKSELGINLPINNDKITKQNDKITTNDELTDKQIFALEYMFNKNKYMDLFCKSSTSSRLNLTPSQIDKWFQKRRLLEDEEQENT